jgi:hypothetical protein
MKKTKIIVGFLVLVVLMVVILFVSLKALPGSSMYTFRLNFSEKIMGITKLNDLEKAKYALYLADQRLNELSTMKDKNTLGNGENLTRDNFNQQTMVVQNSIINLSRKEGGEAKDVLQLSEDLDVQIEKAKAIFNLDQLEVLPEGAPVPKATSTPSK